MILSLIVAMSENRVIGRDNQLPWRLSADLKQFKKITMGHPMIMGRKTFESIGRVLPGRDHFIVSRQKDYLVPGAVVVSSITEALELAQKNAKEVFVIGGAEIYRQILPLVTRIYLTEVHRVIEGDTFFPEFSRADFKEISRENFVEGDIQFSMLVLEKIRSDR